jgi:CheY-like chemotaxis protein
MAKLLIAEDDEFLRKVYRAKFEGLGFEIKLANNGEEVGPILKDFIPDIILLDLVMPKKDGFEVLKELRASAQFKDIPVLVTTNLGQPDDKQKALSLGATEYIVKTDTPIQGIVDKVKQYLSK